MTVEQVRSRTATIRTYRAIPFLLVAVLSLAGAMFRAAPQTVAGGPINSGDVAWMLTATGLVLLMTPGLSFFYGGMTSAQQFPASYMYSDSVSSTVIGDAFSMSFVTDVFSRGLPNEARPSTSNASVTL